MKRSMHYNQHEYQRPKRIRKSWFGFDSIRLSLYSIRIDSNRIIRQFDSVSVSDEYLWWMYQITSKGNKLVSNLLYWRKHIMYKGWGRIRPFSRPQNISLFCIKIKSTCTPDYNAKVYFWISLNRFFDLFPYSPTGIAKT